MYSLTINPSPKPLVAVAMSGGVDSSVAALLLKEAGCSVVGFTFKLWDEGIDESSEKTCCTTEMARDAGKVCAGLGIPHYTLDLRQDFQREVIAPFENEYIQGRTPNPCIRCNSRLKWEILYKKVQPLGLTHIATGHYARVESDENGTMRLWRAVDRTKDQSYFLYDIPPSLLKWTILPLGGISKAQTREIARQAGLPTADKTESQEVCFIPGDDYRSWLKARHPESGGGLWEGEMVDTSGRVLGRHRGYPFFTIGQRKKLGLGGDRKYYVIHINPHTKQVILGDDTDLVKSEFKVGNINWLSHSAALGEEFVDVKIRYRDPGIPAQLIALDDNSVLVKTSRPVHAVTPGQSAVFYRGEEVVGGGVIN